MEIKIKIPCFIFLYKTSGHLYLDIIRSFNLLIYSIYNRKRQLMSWQSPVVSCGISFFKKIHLFILWEWKRRRKICSPLYVPCLNVPNSWSWMGLGPSWTEGSPVSLSPLGVHDGRKQGYCQDLNLSILKCEGSFPRDTITTTLNAHSQICSCYCIPWFLIVFIFISSE